MRRAQRFRLRFWLFQLVLLCCLSPIPAQHGNLRARQTGEVLARVYYKDQHQLNSLARRLDIWKVNQGEKYALVALRTEMVAELRAQGIRVEEDKDAIARLSSSFYDYCCYRSVEQVEAELNSLARAYPTLVQLNDIGDSWEKNIGNGGYDLWALTITQRSVTGPKARLLILAGIHPREVAPPEVALEFVRYLLAGYGQNAEVTWILDHTEIHLIPLVNPDGHKYAEQGYYQRKNTNRTHGAACPQPTLGKQYGVDLNRNSDWAWGGAGSSADPCEQTYRGEAGASEPETRAVQDYILKLFPDQRGAGESEAAPEDTTGILISLHSFGNEVLWGWAFTDQPAPNAQELGRIGAKFASLTGYRAGQTSTAKYLCSGLFEDFAYGSLGIPAFTFEISDSFFPDCKTLPGLFAQSLGAFLYAARIARAPYSMSRGPEVHLEQSGTITASGPVSGRVTLVTASSDRTIERAEIAIDTPPWQQGLSIQMEAVDGAFDSASEGASFTVPAELLSPGRHILYFTACDNAGSWGPAMAMFVDVASDPAPDLALSMKHLGTFRPGAEVSYELGVLNRGTGTAALPVRLTDDLPEGLRFLSASGPDWECRQNGKSLVCDRSQELLPGQSGSLSVTARVDGEGMVLLTNRASVEVAGDRNPKNNHATDSATVLEAVPVPRQGTSTLHFPHFGDGAGLLTQFMLTNPSSLSAVGSLTFYDAAGNLMPVLIDGTEVSSTVLDLAANVTVSFATGGTSSPFKAGYAEAQLSQGTVLGQAVLKYADGRETSVLAVQAGNTFQLPVQKSPELESGVAVWRADISSPVQLVLHNADGATVENGTMELSGYHQGAKFISELFPNLPSEFSGSLRISSASAIAPVALRFGQRGFSAAPVFEAKPSAQLTVERLVGMWVFSYPAEGVSYLDKVPIFETWADSEQPGRFWAAGANRNSDPVLGFCDEPGEKTVLVSPGALYDDIYEVRFTGTDILSGCYYSRYKNDGSYSRCYPLTGIRVTPAAHEAVVERILHEFMQDE